MADDSAITHVADTALWVATYRALESERSDALFHDKLAGLLAGERGRSIAATMPYPRIMAWALVVRTVAIDELIRDAINLGIDTVVNLGQVWTRGPIGWSYRQTFDGSKWISLT